MEEGEEHQEDDGKKKDQNPHKSAHEHEKCLRCGGKLVVSRKSLIKSRSVWWQKPWGSAIHMDEPVVSYACISCGSVYFFLRNKSKVIREYKELSERDKDLVGRM